MWNWLRNLFRRKPKSDIVRPVVEVTPSVLLSSLADRRDWGHKLLGIEGAWKWSRGRGVKVAVLDTGCDMDHPDLKAGIKGSKDFTGGSGAGDKDGHGTFCAGVIGARADGRGIVGVAPYCDLYIAKVLGDDGQGGYGAIVRGIEWAMAIGCEVISMSIGGQKPWYKLHQACKAANARGCYIFAAAGNDARGLRDTIDYPARYQDPFAVGAVSKEMMRAGFSSAGSALDFMAPGVNNYSTHLNGNYTTMSGTSMATPFAAGVAALIIAKHKKNPGNTPINSRAALKEHMLRHAIKRPDMQGISYGGGIINPGRVFDSE